MLDNIKNIMKCFLVIVVMLCVGCKKGEISDLKYRDVTNLRICEVEQYETEISLSDDEKAKVIDGLSKLDFSETDNDFEREAGAVVEISFEVDGKKYEFTYHFNGYMDYLGNSYRLDPDCFYDLF